MSADAGKALARDKGRFLMSADMLAHGSGSRFRKQAWGLQLQRRESKRHRLGIARCLDGGQSEALSPGSHLF